jgi:hypothetical protein
VNRTRSSNRREEIRRSTEQLKHDITLKLKFEQQEKLILSQRREIEALEVAKARLEGELERQGLELKKARIELAITEERKTESEQCYKNEIKYLIDKLLKTKNKL